ncbi:hypothetical protein ACPCHQ_21800 [Ralstonia thomasii]|uniref:hypothetical protein n=1 Tax=Ralstonia thomasii TaxID=3058596 RepID=UPI003C2B5321
MHTFEVIGSGAFPADMLRYDECWPARAEDAAAVVLETENLSARQSRRRVRLCSHKSFAPAIVRWESFGWQVAMNECDA